MNAKQLAAMPLKEFLAYVDGCPYSPNAIEAETRRRLHGLAKEKLCPHSPDANHWPRVSEDGKQIECVYCPVRMTIPEKCKKDFGAKENDDRITRN